MADGLLALGSVRGLIEASASRRLGWHRHWGSLTCPSYKPKVFYHSFQYQAKSWQRSRRVVAKIDWYAGALLGFELGEFRVYLDLRLSITSACRFALT